MNETNETETKKMSKYQTLKIKIQQKVMHVLTVSMVLGTVAVGNAAALNNTSFQGISDVIQAIIPIFGDLIDLTIAVVPYTIIVMIVGGLGVMLKKMFSKSF